MAKILVTGATGQLGKAVVYELLKKVGVDDLAVLARDVSKADALQALGVEVIQGDYNDYSSLLNAFKGVDKLYFVSSSDVMQRLVQHEHVVKAAVAADVRHIFYTSAQRKSEDGSSPIALVGDAHWKTDLLIKSSGITYTILKHGLYTDILPLFMGDKVIETGIVVLPAGDGKASFVTRKDLAVAAAVLLTTAGHENKVYELGGDASVSFHDIAGMLSELSGKPIQYVSPSAEVFAEQLKGYGLTDEMVQGTVTFCLAIEQGEFDFPSDDLVGILGREPDTVKNFLKEAYKL